MHTPQPAAQDPRDIVTPDAFTVDPALLGTPLAKPGARAFAMLLDFIIVSILVKIIGGALAGVAAAVVFFRLARQTDTGGVLRRWMARGLRLAAVVLTFVFTLNIIRGVGGWFDGDEAVTPEVATGARAAQAQAEVYGLLGNPLTWTPPPETVGEDPDGAQVDDDAEAPAAATSPIAVIPAQPVEDALDAMTDHQDELEEQLEDARAGLGLRRIFAGISDDLGLGFGWFALYFTGFLVLWNGQTPGKRLLRIRVIRLDARPLSWWMAFERFGGYAASFSTGLLGFAQILWDRNRQGLHDKAVETVVVQEARKSVSA